MSNILILDSINDSIECVLSSAKTTNDPVFMTSYADNNGSVFTEISNDGTLNGITDVTIVSSPAALTRRIVKSIFVYNDDTVTITFTVSLNNNGTIRKLFTESLGVNETYEWLPSENTNSVEINTDGTLGGNSDYVVPSQKAVKTYVDTEISEIPEGITEADVIKWAIVFGG